MFEPRPVAVFGPARPRRNHRRSFAVLIQFHFTRMAAKNRLPTRFPKVTAASVSQFGRPHRFVSQGVRDIGAKNIRNQSRKAHTNQPIDRETPPWNYPLYDSHGCDHHVARHQFLASQYNPVPGGNQYIVLPITQHFVDTHITSPTGKTKPPMTLSRPGLFVLIDGEPP